MNSRRAKIKNTQNLAFLLPLVLLALLVIGFVIYHFGFAKNTSNTAGNSMRQAQAGASGTNSNKSAQPSSGAQLQKGITTPTSPATGKLVAPTGDFVSDHHPNLSGKPAPNLISSVCNTTSGAQCQITFTKDGVVKSLPPRTTDEGGSAYWDWTLQQIGLTAGTWKIQAVATLNGQTKSSDDAMDLVVSP